jgi:hypothetical protein
MCLRVARLVKQLGSSNECHQSDLELENRRIRTSLPCWKRGLNECWCTRIPRIPTVAAKNTMLAVHSWKNTLWPLNSKRYAQPSQCTCAAVQIPIQRAPFFQLSLLAGMTTGRRQKNHTKYCAVITWHAQTRKELDSLPHPLTEDKKGRLDIDHD